LGTAIADAPRSDANKSLGYTGNHGFTFVEEQPKRESLNVSELLLELRKKAKKCDACLDNPLMPTRANLLLIA
jgi:hypothetical protein